MTSRLPLLALLLGISAACRETDWVDTAVPLHRDDDGDGFAGADDCDDTDAAVHPGADETCDGVDEDCNGTIDDGAPASTFYIDVDGDGYGDGTASVQACVAPEGHVAQAGDCDDSNAAYNPGADESDCSDPADYNCDGSSAFSDLDNDGFPACEDCNDQAPTIHPGAPEICGGPDEDCDGSFDEPGAQGEQSWYRDVDGDGHGDPATGADSCNQPSGFVADSSDCDDLNASAYPGHPEVCDSADNDCDGSIDDDATDRTLWFDDQDSDGFGDPIDTVLACEAPAGFIDTGDDCDDALPQTYPGAPELCDGLDNDCNDLIDDDATGVGTWYADDDDDGYGRDGAQVTTCTPPPGYAGVGGDCNDGNAAIHPAATEVCDGADNDCDLDTDEPDASDAVAWHIDADADGYGTSAADQVACAAPAGFTDNTDDCDDADNAVNPGATEVCDGIDNDCSGEVDEDSASDAATWHPDSDDDGYGDGSIDAVACSAPAGHVSDGTDCDDADPNAFPGAPDVVWDGVDNDCDGTPDQDAHLGTGQDGPLQVSGTIELDSWIPSSRSTPLAVGFGVTDINGDEVDLDAPATGLVAGDEVLLINLQGSAARHAAVGRYAFHRVASTSGTRVTLTQPVTVVLGESSNADLTDQIVVMQRVPNFTWVNVAVGTQLTAAPWSGAAGGVLAFRSNDAVAVRNGAALHVDAGGYWGGETGASSNCDATQGESYAGPGVGGNTTGCTGGYNHANGSQAWQRNHGGGGAHITGAGGEHAGGAEGTISWNGASPPSQAGATYGTAALSTLFLGSGGGGVWNGPPDPGPGGNGAGILYVSATSIQTIGTGVIAARGGTTDHWATGSYTYGAGGGAGGSIWLAADELILATGSVLATGGLGKKSGVTRDGGNGGVGRIRMDYGTVNGVAYGAGGHGAQTNFAADPNPGWRAGL